MPTRDGEEPDESTGYEKSISTMVENLRAEKKAFDLVTKYNYFLNSWMNEWMKHKLLYRRR